MENLILNLFVSFVIAFMASNIFATLYNVFVAIPKGIKISKNKHSLKTVTATRIVLGLDDALDKRHKTSGKTVFVYKWEAEGKQYKRRIITRSWPLPVDTFYYIDDPKYAMPEPKELARFRYTAQLFCILWLIVFIFVMVR